jgi:hypothetical protein
VAAEGSARNDATTGRRANASKANYLSALAKLKSPAIIPVAVSLLVTANTLWNRFAVDDQQQVLNNTLIRNLRNLPLAFTSSVWTFSSADIVFTTDSSTGDGAGLL